MIDFVKKNARQFVQLLFVLADVQGLDGALVLLCHVGNVIGLTDSTTCFAIFEYFHQLFESSQFEFTRWINLKFKFEFKLFSLRFKTIQKKLIRSKSYAFVLWWCSSWAWLFSESQLEEKLWSWIVLIIIQHYFVFENNKQPTINFAK